MHTIPENTPKSRKCTSCKEVKPLTKDIFGLDKSRLYGFSYECRNCHLSRKKLRGDNRSDRWGKLTQEQKEKVKARQKRYSKTPKGRAINLINAYQRVDECDFTSDELSVFLQKPCVHCGTTDHARGLDRIDNSRGHTKDNVAPSCVFCNFARGDRFSFEEMQEVGMTIRKILARRNITYFEH